MRSFMRARTRASTTLIVFIIAVAAGLPARAGTSQSAPTTETIDESGSGSVVGSVRTPALRQSIPAGDGPRILLVGTGVQKSLFPEALRGSIVTAATADATDVHGYGTLAASTLLQLIPDATIVSKAVRPADANWFQIDLTALASTLDWARANRGSFDVVLLAFPPQAALDPISHAIGYGDYGRFGRGLHLVQDALLTARAPTQGPVVGIPTDAALRRAMFANANLKQQDAVERFATQAVAWRRAVASVSALSEAGITVVAPAGDFTRRNGGQILPLVTQTTYGISSLPSVVTVGAAYADGGITRVSPISGRGPTLALGSKPDLLAPSDVLGMLPANARLQWPDDSSRAPLQMLEWAKPGVAPSSCPPLTGAYRCVLQGSSMVSASIVGANIAALVASGTPNGATSRSASDDEVLRGIVWAAASRQQARAFGADRPAFAWEQGAGVLSGVRGFDHTAVPVALARADAGEVAWGRSKSITVPVWSGGAPLRSADAAVNGFLGPDPNGKAVSKTWSDPGRVDASIVPGGVALAATGERAQGGIYGGTVSLNGGASSIPLTLTQTLPVDVHVDYAYNEFQANGGEGERVEDAGVVLFAGLPSSVGLISDSFKNFGSTAWSKFGGDPTNSVFVRAARTQSAFRTPGLPASEHGRARIPDVPPGFYRFHVLSNHAVDAVQARGRAESLGIQLGSFGVEGVDAGGTNLLVPSCAGTLAGPLPCANRASGDADIDPSSGLCVVRDQNARVTFSVYCGEIAYAMPSALVTRAIHQIEHAIDPARSEWKTCSVDIPTDGKQIDFQQVVRQAQTCGGPTAPTGWSFGTEAPSCLAPSEKAAYPSGAPTDVDATYSGAGSVSVPGRNLPVGVMTYEFRLPHTNTYTIGGLSFSYAAENAIVGVRFRTGPDNLAGDASNGIVAVHGPSVSVAPQVPGAGARGTSYSEWSMMSANAATGQVSVIVIPTAWARQDLDPTKPIARVQLCDIGLKIATFAKQAWGQAGADGTQFYPTLDRGLIEQIDPSKSRVRAAYTGGSFVDAGRESEALTYAVHIPKNTTTDATAPHHVRSPAGGPATFTGARRLGVDGSRQEQVLDGSYRAHDPAEGLISVACAENAADTVAASVCKAWNAARASNATIAELGPDLSVNGRFFGVLPVSIQTLTKAGGAVAFESAIKDDGGAFESRWATRNGASVKRFTVSDFYDELGTPMPLELLNGLISISGAGGGLPVLTVRTADAGGSSHTITARLA